MAGRAKVQHGVTSETGKGTITLPSLLPSSCCTWHGSALRTRYTSQPFPHHDGHIGTVGNSKYMCFAPQLLNFGLN